jgi:hypothetical protein
VGEIRLAFTMMEVVMDMRAMLKSTNLKRLLAAGLAGSAIFAAAPAFALTTFFNDWDSTDFGAAAFYTILPAYEGWTSVAGDGIEVQYNNVAGAPLSGENLVELDSNNNSTMERLIDAGDYTLRFYYSPRPGIGIGSNGIDVLVNGTSIFNVSGNGGGGTAWALQSVNFSLLAPGSLRFAAIGTSDSLGGYLENISLGAAVPEPATWGMMIVGFSGMGGVLRSRRRQSARPA